jgi:ABC-type lipoprotein release transport system permease subunit
MVFKNLLRRKSRSILTLAGIAIGVAAMIALGALAGGIASGYQSMAGGSQADLVLSQKDSYDLTLSSVDEYVGGELMAMPEVREVAGTLMGNVSVDEGAQYFFIFGHDPEGFAIDRYRVVEGEDLSARSSRGRPILLGKVAAEAMEVKVGQTLHLTGGAFRVAGIYETGDSFEDGAAVMTLEDAQTLLQKHRLVGAYYLKLKDSDMSPRLQAKVERQYPDLTLATAAEFGDKQQMVDYLKGMGWAIGFLAILVGGVGMTNTVLMSVFERTREIGVLRAVGWRSGRVLRLIMGESLILAFVGAAIGTLMGVALVLAIRDVALLGFVHGEFSVGLFAQAFIIAILLGVFGGLYPAWRASRLIPLEAMRYDGGGGSRRNGLLKFTAGSMALKNLLRRKTRTALTLLAIGIGIGVVVAMGGIMDGFKGQINTMIGGGNAHLAAMEAGISDMGYSAIDERVGSQIAAHPSVAHVSGAVIGALTNVGEAPFFIFFGYHPQEAAIQHFKIVEGEPLRANRQLVLGRAAADAMGMEVGDTIRLNESAYRVVGISETGTGWEDAGAVMTMRDAQMLLGKPRQVTLYSIELHDPREAPEMRDWLNENYPQIDVSLTSEFADSMPDFEASSAMIGGLTVLMALVGSVGMTNTILMSVLERTREIGVLRALGWSRRRVLGMVLRESLLLAFLGGLTGIAIGFLLVKLLAVIPAVGGLFAASITPTIMVQAIAVALFLGALGGLYPAWRATRLRPVEALRYE